MLHIIKSDVNDDHKNKTQVVINQNYPPTNGKQKEVSPGDAERVLMNSFIPKNLWILLADIEKGVPWTKQSKHSCDFGLEVRAINL